MDIAFLTHCKNSLAREGDLFSRTALKVLQGGSLEKKEAEKLLDLLFQEEVVSYGEYLAFLKKVISWVFLVYKEPFFPSDFSIQALIAKIYKVGFFGRFPFAETLEALIFFLLKKEFSISAPKVLSNGSVLIESLAEEREWKLPDLERGSLLAILWLFIGKISVKEEFLKASFQLSSWFLKVIDKKASPFVGLWKEELHLKEKQLSCSLYLMFDLIGAFFQSPTMQKMGAALWEKSEPKEAIPELFFYALLAKETSSEERYVSVFLEEEKEENVSWDPDLFFVRYRGKDFESALTLTGDRSSMGAFHLGSIQIRSFGPQWFPLGDPSRFGVVRFPDAQCRDKDWEFTAHSNSYSLRAFTSLCSPSGNAAEFLLPAHWMEVKNSVHKEKFILDLKFQGEFQEKLGFVFYVHCKNCFVDGQMNFLAGSLQRYEGPVRKVVFQDQESALQIKAENFYCMHLIPLGRNNAFWNSNFLLAYEIHPQNLSCTLQIEKK